MKMQVYLDLDGVLADFDQGSIDMLGTEFKNTHEVDDERWNIVKEQAPEFFRYLPLMEGAKDLLSHVDRVYGPCYYILSAVPDAFPPASLQKCQWLNEVMGMKEYFRICLVRREDKATYARPDRVLVDDYHKNVQEWADNGGIAIHFEDVPTTIGKLKHAQQIIEL